MFNFSSKNMVLSAWILAFFSLLSAALGLFRDRFLANIFGAGRELSIYAAAFRIPDLVYSLLIAGGLAIAFLPVFSDYFSKNEARAWRAASNVLNVFLVFLALLSLLLFVLAPQLAALIVPGFSLEDQLQTASLMRILFLSPILFGMANVFSGILQYFHRFVAIGAAPVFYNLGIISGILFLSPRLGILGAGIGVIIGAFLYFLSQLLSAVSCGFVWEKEFNFKDEAMRSIFRLAVPRLISIVSQQINLLVITGIASTISAGAIAIFYYSGNLQGLVVSLVGVSFASAVFPLLTKSLSGENKESFVENFSRAFGQIFFFVIPLSMILFLLRSNIVAIILQSGKFDQASMELTAMALGIFAFSIFAQAGNHLLVRTFFSLKQGRRPAEIAVLSSVLNASLAVILVNVLKNRDYFSSEFPIIGLVLAFSVSAVFQFGLLFASLKKRLDNQIMIEIFASLKKTALASFLMLFFVVLTMKIRFSIGWQTIFVSLVAGIAYLTAAWFLRSPELDYLKKTILRRLND